MTQQLVRAIGVPREQVLAAALSLFIHHGVRDTSLSLLADQLGVSRAVVHHQFATKSDLVLAMISPSLDAADRLAETAQNYRSPAARRAFLLTGLVDLMIVNRRLAAVVYADSVVSQLATEHPRYEAVCRRIRDLLIGGDSTVETQVQVTLFGGALMMVGIDPDLAELDDETLHRHLTGTARRILRLRPPACGTDHQVAGRRPRALGLAGDAAGGFVR